MAGSAKQECPLCTHSSTQPLRTHSAFVLWRCLHCNLHWVKNEHVPRAGAIYTEAYYAQNYAPRVAALKAYFAAELGASFTAPGKVLDVGFGVGAFLDAALERGWDVTGVEASPSAFEGVRGRLGARASLWLGDLLERSFPPRVFDLVCFWDVLAHVPDPAAYLARVTEWLKPGGQLWIKTPVRPPQFFASVGRLPATLALSLLHWPTQLFHFDENSLTAATRRLEYETLDWRLTPEPAPAKAVRPSILRHPRGWLFSVVHGLYNQRYPQRSAVLKVKKACH